MSDFDRLARLSFNGVVGDTGERFAPPASIEELDAWASALLAGGPPRVRVPKPGEQWLDLPEDVNPRNLAQAGWAVVFAHDAPAEIRRALDPLLAHRREAMGSRVFKTLTCKEGQLFDEKGQPVVVYPGEIEPKQLPYYVMFVGDPASVPFAVQAKLQEEYAVGRLDVPTPEAYRAYATSLVRYETETVPQRPELVSFAPRLPDDGATELSESCLARPLVEGVGESDARSALPPPALAELASPAVPVLSQTALLAKDATKANLTRALHHPDAAPAILFAVSHGQALPRGHANQRAEQGAILCQDWSGQGRVEAAHCFAAADVGDDARIAGAVAFLFACFGAGTPAVTIGGGRARDCGGTPAFTAALPQALLSHPRGGMLGVIGHVDRAFGWSIQPPDLGPQISPFRDVLIRLRHGHRLGHAVRPLWRKYTQLATRALALHRATEERPDPFALAVMLADLADFRNYVLLGDPAARLSVERWKS